MSLDPRSILLQQHFNSSLASFNRSWSEFRVSIGNYSTDYWIGNDRLNQLTQYGDYLLNIQLQSAVNRAWYSAQYDLITVGNALSGYPLQLGTFAGTAGDANTQSPSTGSIIGMRFTTYDRDNDFNGNGNCALLNGGGFWYRDCCSAHLNNAKTTSYGFTWAALPPGDALMADIMCLVCRKP